MKNWTITARDARRIIAAEMKYIRITSGLIWTGYKTNTETANELYIIRDLEKSKRLQNKLDTLSKQNVS